MNLSDMLLWHLGCKPCTKQGGCIIAPVHACKAEVPSLRGGGGSIGLITASLVFGIFNRPYLLHQ